MKKYYLQNGTEQYGPFDISELNTKNITRKTLVWYEGIPDWIVAEKIKELLELFEHSMPPPIKNKTSIVSSESKKKKASKKIVKNLVPLVLIIGAFVIAFVVITLVTYNSSDLSPASYAEKRMSIEEIENADPIRFLSAKGKYNESFWGTKIKIRGSISNTATMADYKDVTVRVTYYSRTMSVLGSKEYTLYEVYKPRTTTPFRLDIANFKDVDTIRWEVISALPH
ncbi:MAG: DUF4339 domain-containing protein [Flavobacteriaceae bacterium]|nr:DUF4339 domain-containing protein [Flavobacteriaceae bacterium]